MNPNSLKNLKPGPKGNKGGGRKTDTFIEWCRGLTHDGTARMVYEARNRSGDLNVMKFAAEYAHGKPSQLLEHSGEVTIKVEYD